MAGISQVTIFGAGQYAMRIWVKPDQLAKLNITVPEIINAVNSQNTVNPAGKIGGRPTPARAGIHLHRPAPKAGSRRRTNLATSSFAPPRTGRLCA